MGTNGPFDFKLSLKAVEGVIDDELGMFPGEWAWKRQGGAGDEFLAVYCCCPDCGLLMTIWRRFGTDAKGHTIDAAGNVSPSILHNYPVDGKNACGFHSIPTRLIGFVDLRTS